MLLPCPSWQPSTVWRGTSCVPPQSRQGCSSSSSWTSFSGQSPRYGSPLEKSFRSHSRHSFLAFSSARSAAASLFSASTVTSALSVVSRVTMTVYFFMCCLLSLALAGEDYGQRCQAGRDALQHVGECQQVGDGEAEEHERFGHLGVSFPLDALFVPTINIYVKHYFCLVSLKCEIV